VTRWDRLQHLVTLLFHPIKILITFAQVLSALGPVLHVQYPPFMYELTDVLRLLMLNVRDWIQVDCLHGAIPNVLWSTLNTFGSSSVLHNIPSMGQIVLGFFGEHCTPEWVILGRWGRAELLLPVGPQRLCHSSRSLFRRGASIPRCLAPDGRPRHSGD
jgi:hypothetical protein